MATESKKPRKSQANRSHINLYQLSRRSEVSDAVITDILDVILACMEEGVEVRLRGFGKFTPEIKPETVKKTSLVEGGSVVVPRRRTIRFTMSRALKKQWTNPKKDA